jgi:hypothetical protein
VVDKTRGHGDSSFSMIVGLIPIGNHVHIFWQVLFCWMNQNFYAVGGSRSDATIRLGVTYYPSIEIPELSKSQADKLAEEKCATWGYSGAEAFGGARKHCTTLNCAEVQILIEYQCLGAPSVAVPTPAPQMTETPKKKKKASTE